MGVVHKAILIFVECYEYETQKNEHGHPLYWLLYFLRGAGEFVVKEHTHKNGDNQEKKYSLKQVYGVQLH